MSDSEPVLFDRSPIRWLILAAGIVIALYVFKYRQPPTTSDFTIFYQSAAAPAADMYKGPRLNLNPPHFSLLIEPLTWLPMNVAAEVWRALNIAALCGCLWWLATRQPKKWSAADVGAVLAWAPFHHAFALNQVTWIMWPLLVAAWWQWRHDRWVAGAIWFGIALSFKSFLGVFLIWLAFRQQWRAIGAAVVTAGIAFTIGILAYGVDVFAAWIGALNRIDWTATWTNASFQALFSRTMTKSMTGTVPVVDAPALVKPLVLICSVAIVLTTCVITRRRTVDGSWPALTVSALLASPLGWMYYAWWMLPGVKPSQLLVRSPLLWIPMTFMTRGQPSVWATLTFASMYVWGLLIAWASFVAASDSGESEVRSVKSASADVLRQ